MEHCIIHNGNIVHNGNIIFATQSDSFTDFAKKAFKALQIDYPKFFKMDSLSKLAFLAAEIVLRQLTSVDKQGVALLFANKSASLDTDLKHQASINDKENYYPSPAVFVYTLPNICLGEISIRHQLKTENTFFIFDSYPEIFFKSYSNILIKNNIATKVLCGWVELLAEDYKAEVILVGN